MQPVSTCKTRFIPASETLALAPGKPACLTPRVQTRFIVNPRSGAALKAVGAVRAFAAAHGATVVLTERPAHASELAAQALAEGCDLIVAVGGDGTMNEVARVLTGTPATLGLLPSGSGDGLGRHLGIHGSMARALDILRTGRPRLIDTGLADGHPFFTVAGLGFEAEISARFNRLARRGFFRYLTTSATALRSYSPETYRISQDGGAFTARAFTLAIANVDQYGNSARIAPAARVDDGRLDLTVVPPVHFFNGVSLLTRLFAGSLRAGRDVICLAGPRFTVERPAPGLIHTDGETHHAGTTIEFSVRPASLRVLCPQW